ncbi:MAG: methyltransferase domain-containing protein [Armatimonadota bacterium]|nr:methyltransferase domain-containing protein [Armatimonadota bacterium]
MSAGAVKHAVRSHYAALAREGSAGCGCGCAPPPASRNSGVVPLSLGCGSPVAHADLAPGEVVVDLGSGAGLEVLRAAQAVGPYGQAVGVDMTAEMVVLARRNAAALGVANARFVVAELESLPLPEGFADVVLSNCVVNLVPDKAQAFREAHRVLRPGGRLVVSDVVADRPLSPELREDPRAWSACVAGAVSLREYFRLLAEAGFQAAEVLEESRADCGDPWRVSLRSATLRARKPLG